MFVVCMFVCQIKNDHTLHRISKNRYPSNLALPFHVQKVLSEGVQLWQFCGFFSDVFFFVSFLVDEGREDQNTIIGLPAKRH